MDDLGQLTYTRMVIEEAMRLYPAAWITSRQAGAADQLGPYRLPAGSQVMINITGIHRHPAYWDPDDGRENLDEEGLRVMRGGSWYTGQGRVRCGYRFWNFTRLRNDLGYRLARGLSR